MRVENWDMEARKVAGEVLAIEDDLRKLFKSEKAILIRKKVAIGHYQVVFDQLVEKFQRFARKKLPLTQRQAAVLHWGAVLSDKTMTFYKKRARFLGHFMWLHLIKARLTGGGPNPQLLVDDNDLLELALRKNQLFESEKFLTDQLVKLENIKRALHYRYEKDQAIHMNIEASGTLQGRIGDDLADALSNPSYRALERFFKRMSLTVRERSHKETEIEALGKLIIDETDRLVLTCRDLILKPSGRPIANDRLQRLEGTLRTIERMQTQMIELSEDVMSFSPPQAHPIFLKKSRNRATRGGLTTHNQEHPQGRPR